MTGSFLDSVVLTIFLATIVSKNGTSCVSDSDSKTERCNGSSIIIVVDQSHGEDCSLLKSLQENPRENLTCTDVKDTLLLLASPAEGCVEVIINQGTYTIEGTVTIPRDVHVHAKRDHTVVIIFSTTGPVPPEYMYSLSFNNSQFVSVTDIQFIGSDGVIGFDNVSKVIVSDSSFR